MCSQRRTIWGSGSSCSQEHRQTGGQWPSFFFFFFFWLFPSGLLTPNHLPSSHCCLATASINFLSGLPVGLLLCQPQRPSFPSLLCTSPDHFFLNPPIPTDASILHSPAALDGWPQVLNILQLVYFWTSQRQSSTWLLLIHTLVLFVLFLLKSLAIVLRVNFHLNSSRTYWQNTVK